MVSFFLEQELEPKIYDVRGGGEAPLARRSRSIADVEDFESPLGIAAVSQARSRPSLRSKSRGDAVRERYEDLDVGDEVESLVEAQLGVIEPDFELEPVPETRLVTARSVVGVPEIAPLNSREIRDRHSAQRARSWTHRSQSAEEVEADADPGRHFEARHVVRLSRPGDSGLPKEIHPTVRVILDGGGQVDASPGVVTGELRLGLEVDLEDQALPLRMVQSEVRPDLPRCGLGRHLDGGLAQKERDENPLQPHSKASALLATSPASDSRSSPR